MKLLKQMCEIHAPAGEELAMTNFLLNYIEENKKNWKTQPILHYGK
jgi:putative aminopeptidase FrvX